MYLYDDPYLLERVNDSQIIIILVQLKNGIPLPKFSNSGLKDMSISFEQVSSKTSSVTYLSKVKI